MGCQCADLRALRSLPSAILLVAVLSVNVLTADARPASNTWTDTAVVESTIRETYAHPPADLLQAASNHGVLVGQGSSTSTSAQSGKQHRAAGAGGKHGKGFHHKQSSTGNDGYKHFDAFHTKSGDKYGYEQHSSFGKKKNGGNNHKYGAQEDEVGFAGSHPDVEVVRAASRMSPRSQSLQDVSGDASFTRENAKYRRGLTDDDMFFVFSGDGNEQQDDGGEAAQQQQEDDDGGEHDDGEAAEQQEASDDDDDDEGGQQQQQQQAEDDYDY